MNESRRRFLNSTAVLALGLGAARRGRAGAGLDLLILGGTGFIGPHIVRAALERDHRMTLFNRGRSDPDLFAELERLLGDRAGHLAARRDRLKAGLSAARERKLLAALSNG